MNRGSSYVSTPPEFPRPRVVLLAYYVLALVCSPLNRMVFGDYAAVVSVSYAPLVVLLASYGIHALRYGIPHILAFLFIGVVGITAISALHLTDSYDAFLLKFPLFYLLAILVAANATEADVRAIVFATHVCAAVYVFVGIPLWYSNVATGVLTPSSFSEAMFFQKQDYTVALTLVAGMFLYELLLSEERTRRRRYVMALQAAAIGIGATLFYIKSLFVVVAGSIGVLWLLRVQRARKYVLVMAAGFIALYVCYERLMLLELLPDQVVAYVAWLFDDRYLTADGARSLDTLTMRLEILAENFDVMRTRLSSLLFGIGKNTAADASFISYLSGREGDLPVEMESGLLQFFVYTGITGLCIVLASYGYAFKAWVSARQRQSASDTAVFSCVATVNLALLTSNIFQDNLASVTWYWLGLLWYCVARHRRSERPVPARQSYPYDGARPASRQPLES